MRRMATLLLLALVACLGLSGCRTVEQSRPAPFRRLLILHFADEPPYCGTGRQLARLLGDKISTVTAGADAIVVSPRAVGLADVSRTLRRGRIPLQTLQRARKKYHADTILIGQITDFDPYADPAVALNLKVFQTADAALVAGVSRRWSAASPEVKKQVKEYYRRCRSREECRFGPNMFLTSPRYFLIFVADRIARAHLLSPSLLAGGGR